MSFILVGLATTTCNFRLNKQFTLLQESHDFGRKGSCSAMKKTVECFGGKLLNERGRLVPSKGENSQRLLATSHPSNTALSGISVLLHISVSKPQITFST